MMILLEQAQTVRFQELKALIDAGLESIDAERVSVVTDELIADIKRQANQNRPQINARGRAFTGVRQARIKALKPGVFNPTEELNKMNE
jgi:outer membrane PBP1 activator LpoA protein